MDQQIQLREEPAVTTHLCVEEALEEALVLGRGTYLLLVHPEIGWAPCVYRMQPRLDAAEVKVILNAAPVAHVCMRRVIP